jgi:glutamine cyclotransferase
MSRPRPACLAALPMVAAILGMAGAGVCAKPSARPASAPVHRLKVLRAFPHDPQAFTQGLLLLDGKLYESTGLLGQSSLRRVDLASGQVEQQVVLPPELFGEGLARVGERFFQVS